jgi:nucleoside-diphosphate-sugar epimerase
MKTAIVTGANGFIGAAIVKELLANAVTVYAFVHQNSQNLPIHKNLKIIPFELNKVNELSYGFNDIDVFYHMAWQGSSGEDRSNPQLQYDNIKWTIDCLYLAKKLGAKRFVGAGSLMEKEVLYDVPKRENKPSAVSVYGTAKLSSHYMTKIISAAIGIEHLWCYLTAFGAGDSPQRFVGATISKMLAGDKELKFTKADQCYDFVYITDTAKALYLIGLNGLPFCAYYIGSGNPNKLNNFIKEIKRILNIDCVLNFGTYDYKGIYLPLKEFDCSDLQKDTGFKCSVSFEEGIIKTAESLKVSL